MSKSHSKTTKGLAPLNLFGISINNIKEEILADLEGKVGFEITSDDPMYEVIAYFSYRELLLKQQINNIAQSFCEELEKISNTQFEPCGLPTYYAQKSKEHNHIRDAVVEKKEDGLIFVHILLDNPKPENKEKIRKNLELFLNRDDQKILGDTLVVKLVSPKEGTIKATVYPHEESVIDLESIQQQLVSKIEKENKIGRNFHDSWISHQLHQTGVSHIEITKSLPAVEFNQILEVNVDLQGA